MIAEGNTEQRKVSESIKQRKIESSVFVHALSDRNSTESSPRETKSKKQKTDDKETQQAYKGELGIDIAPLVKALLS